jgi:hypothetical protein
MSTRLRYKLKSQWNKLFEVSESLRSLQSVHAMEITTQEREELEKVNEMLAQARNMLDRIEQT